MGARIPTVVAFLLVACLGDSAAQQPQRLSEPGVSPAVWGVLELPATPGPHPGVVLLPGSGGWRTQNWPRIARIFADSGFAALAIDYYAETGMDTSTADARRKRPLWQATIRNAVAQLRASASSGNPVALVGFSRGAFLAVDVANSTPGVAAVVDFFGGGPADPDSLAIRARRFPPLLILHGDADSIVKLEQAYRLRDAVLAQGGQVTLRVYPGANHGFSNVPAALPDAVHRTLEFLRANLARGGEPRPRERVSLQLALGGGIFNFLNGSKPGAVLEAAVLGSGAAGILVSGWISAPGGVTVGIDPGVLVVLRPAGTTGYLRAGPGYILHRDLKGGGFHLGAGVLLRSRRQALARLGAAFHTYAPGGGVPVLSLTAAVILPGAFGDRRGGEAGRPVPQPRPGATGVADR